MSTNPVGPPTVPLLTHMWDEYKYRHSLCWTAVYKVSAAVLFLAVLPYVKRDLVIALQNWMLVPPVVGTMVAAFGFFVVHNELKLFAETKIAHYDLQKQLVFPFLTKAERRLQEPITPADFQKTLFDLYVQFLILMLFLLSLVNVLFVLHYWIPYLLKQPAKC